MQLVTLFRKGLSSSLVTVMTSNSIICSQGPHGIDTGFHNRVEERRIGCVVWRRQREQNIDDSVQRAAVVLKRLGTQDDCAQASKTATVTRRKVHAQRMALWHVHVRT
jgi:hypothetical protein